MTVLSLSMSVASPMVPGGMRNIHDSKVSGQLSSNSANHHADGGRHGSNEDYMSIVHRLGAEVSPCIMLRGSLHFLSRCSYFLLLVLDV